MGNAGDTGREPPGGRVDRLLQLSVDGKVDGKSVTVETTYGVCQKGVGVRAA